MKIRPPRFKKIEKIEDAFLKTDNQKEKTKLIHFEDLVPFSKNPYPINELEELIESIKKHGLEQNLVVKEKNGKYEVITGNRRYHAIKKILENDSINQYQHLLEISCKVIDSNENDIITFFRLHETNLQTRNILKMEHQEKVRIVEDYLYWLERARKENVLINGKEIKGKTREILAERFNISERTAQDLITKVNKGGNFATPIKKEKSTNEKVVDVINQLDKINAKVEAMIEELNEAQINQIKSSFDAIHEILMFRK